MNVYEIVYFKNVFDNATFTLNADDMVNALTKSGYPIENIISCRFIRSAKVDNTTN